MTIETQERIAKLVARWDAPNGRPLSGKLIDMARVPTDGSEPPSDCMCAQSWGLHHAGMTFAEIAEIDQFEADRRFAEEYGISVAHSILVRQINDSRPDTPSVVLTNPSAILGPNSDIVLAFWRHIDAMTGKQWADAADAADAAADAAWAAAADAAWAVADAAWADAAWAAAADAAAADAAWAARYATLEIIGASVMRDCGRPFVFLPVFGFDTPEDIPLRPPSRQQFISF
jgi:hypothetical protein